MPTAPDTDPPTPTFAEAWHLWLSYRSFGTRPLRASILADYQSIYRHHLASAFGALTLDALDGLTIARFVIARTAGGTSPKRLSNVLVPLRACLRWHHRMGALPSDPSPWFDASAPAADERRILTVPEVERLVAALPAEHRPFVAFAAYVGTRAGEQRALIWDDVDLGRQLVRIDKTLFRDRPQRSTKTGFDRIVPLPPHIATMLADWRACCPASAQRYVFPARTGRPLDLDIFRVRVFKPAVARAGLPASLRFHDLRHTAASLLLQSGATVRDVMAICGWRQLSTAQRYLHPSATLAGAAERLSEARAGALASGYAPSTQVTELPILSARAEADTTAHQPPIR
jgi:integrase